MRRIAAARSGHMAGLRFVREFRPQGQRRRKKLTWINVPMVECF